jgi:predicted 3-demethylubiquinone-9 3-methyltransferase (glyoxalase superfamily)
MAVVFRGKGQDQKIVPTLMFIHENNGKAKEAMELYTQTFLIQALEIF